MLDVLHIYMYTKLKGKSMNTQLSNLLEEANLELSSITDPVLFEIANSFDDREWVRAVEVFLRGIGSTSHVPGKVVSTLWNMSTWYQENRMFTNKQRIWISGHLIRYWDQLSVDMRSVLYM